MPEANEILAARVEIDISIMPLNEEEADIRVGLPHIATMQPPDEFKDNPESWLRAMASVVPLAHEVQKIVGIALAQKITKRDPRLH